MASSDDFSSLREQALRRMHQMYSSVGREEGSTDPPPPPPPPSPPPPEQKPPPQQTRGSHSTQSTHGNSKGGSPLSDFLGSIAGLGGSKGSSSGSILDELNIDEEKAIIGILIYILYKNGADIKLMLALGYLLL